jgi:hypothetical protein
MAKKVTREHYLGIDEYYGDWYRCPRCNNKNVIVNSKYCSECGIKLLWKIDK